MLQTKRLFLLMSLLAGPVLLVGCGGDEPTPVAPPPPEPEPPPPATAPAAPTNVQATLDAATHHVTVTWATAANATTYTVERNLVGSGEGFGQLQSGISGTSYVDENAPVGTLQYRVIAVGAGGSSGASDPAEVVNEQMMAPMGTLSTRVGPGEIRTLSADTVYTLQGVVTVEDGGELHIPAGTHIYGSAEVQPSALIVRAGGTVGGALMAGESSIARLGLGPVREALLQARYVCADGRITSAGAATVKNVSGFDLCRLLVGSLGTLGLVGEVLLRTVPVGETERWVRLAGTDPGAVRSCHTAASVLWDGTDVWTLLSGYGVDVDEDLGRLATLGACEDVDGPPELPPHRWTCTPAEAAAFDARNGAAGRFVAEIGVGVVHAYEPQPSRPVEPGVAELNRRFKERFDPTGRLNPGRDPLRKP